MGYALGCVLGVLALAALVFALLTYVARQDAACAARGGVLVRGNSGQVCVARDALR